MRVRLILEDSVWRHARVATVLAELGKSVRVGEHLCMIERADGARANLSSPVAGVLTKAPARGESVSEIDIDGEHETQLRRLGAPAGSAYPMAVREAPGIGDSVAKGDALILLEDATGGKVRMRSPSDGVVKEVAFGVGEYLTSPALLVSIDAMVAAQREMPIRVEVISTAGVNSSPVGGSDAGYAERVANRAKFYGAVNEPSLSCTEGLDGQTTTHDGGRGDAANSRLGELSVPSTVISGLVMCVFVFVMSIVLTAWSEGELPDWAYASMPFLQTADARKADGEATIGVGSIMGESNNATPDTNRISVEKPLDPEFCRLIGGDGYYYPTHEEKKRITEVEKTYSNGVYAGSIVDGKRCGNGTYYFDNGNIHTGVWVNSLARGIKIFNNGVIEEGHFDENGDLHSGSYFQSATVVYSKGGIYHGKMVAGKRDGFGENVFHNGGIRHASYRNGEIRGDIAQCGSDAQFIYNGGLSDLGFDGEGGLIFPDGTSIEGVFKDSRLVFGVGVDKRKNNAVFFAAQNGGISSKRFQPWCEDRGYGREECERVVARRAALSDINTFHTPDPDGFKDCRERIAYLENYRDQLIEKAARVKSSRP